MNPDERQESQTTLAILVTGSTVGFGAAIARRFVKNGYRVIAAGRRAERLDALRGELGERLYPLPLDITVRQFSLNLKADLTGTNVRVTNVEPGLVGGTEFIEVRFLGDAEKAAKVYEQRSH